MAVGAGQGQCSPSGARGQDLPVKQDPPVPELQHGQDQAPVTCEASVPTAPTLTGAGNPSGGCPSVLDTHPDGKAPRVCLSVSFFLPHCRLIYNPMVHLS